MRWRGPFLATLRQVSQLPGLPDPAGRPPVPCTRGKYRFPGSSHVPGVSSEWYPFPTVRYFYCLGGVPRKGLGKVIANFLAVHILSTEAT